MLLVLLVADVLAADVVGEAGPAPIVEPRVWVGVGVHGSVGALADAPGGGGGAGVEAGARIGKEARRSVALVARVRESVLTGPVRNIGNVEVRVQYPAGTGPHGFLGFSHNHEALAADWLADPVAVSAGVADTLRHRTGFEVGGGWDLPPPYRETAFLARFRPTVSLTAHVFPDEKGPRVYGVAEVGVRLGLDGIGR